MSNSRLPAIGMLLLLIGATATVVVASDVIASRPFCPMCESTSTNGDTVTFEDALKDVAPGSGGIERSTLALQLYRNGTVLWTARNTLPPNLAERLRDNMTFQQRLLDKVEFDETPVGEDKQMMLRVENDTAIIRVVDRDGASHRFGGVVFFTAHKATSQIKSQNEIWWSLNADRVTLRGPSGWVVTQSPGGQLRDHRLEDETIVWESPPNEESDYNYIRSQEAYAFASSNGLGATVFTKLHRVIGGIPAATVFFLKYGAIPGLGVLVGFVLLGRGIHSLRSRYRPVSLRRQSVGVLGIGLVASIASILYPPIIGIALVFLFIGGYAFLVETPNEPASPRLLGGVASLAIVFAMIIWIIVFGFERDSIVMEVQAIAMYISALSIVALSLPFGAFWQTGKRYLALLLVLVPYVLLVIATGAPSYQEAEVWIAIGAFSATSLLSVISGSPLAYLGASLSQPHE